GRPADRRRSGRRRGGGLARQVRARAARRAARCGPSHTHRAELSRRRHACARLVRGRGRCGRRGQCAGGTRVTYALYALAALFLFDALRLRARVGRLGVLADSDELADGVVTAAPGVAIEDSTARAASGYMRAHNIDVLELVPRDLPAIDALALA